MNSQMRCMSVSVNEKTNRAKTTRFDKFYCYTLDTTLNDLMRNAIR
jgi:hypothetical protein